MEFDNKLLDAGRSESSHAPSTGSTGLSAIADEIEAYLKLWLSRLEDLLEHSGDCSSGDAALEARVANFEEEQRRWKLHRQQEMQQMQETAEQLTAAWARLENEQRRLLQAQEASQPRTARRSPEAPANLSAGRATAPPAGTALAQPPGETESGGDAAALSRELAVRQFQQLRRQMGMSGETS